MLLFKNGNAHVTAGTAYIIRKIRGCYKYFVSNKFDGLLQINYDYFVEIVIVYDYEQISTKAQLS